MKRVRISLTVISVLFLPFAAWSQEEGFRVLSYNIRYDNPSDGPNAWDNRKERVAGLIRFHEADLCGLQEALREQIDDLIALLPGYGWCGGGRDDGQNAGEFSPILYRKERFELVASRTFWLSATPLKGGSKGWDAALPRIVTWALLRDRLTGKTFRHFNTHFDHVGEKARQNSARLLLDSARAMDDAAGLVVTGDFNATDSSEVYRIMINQQLLGDALVRSMTPHDGPLSTWNGFREIEEGRRIDFIFVTDDLSVLSHAILSDRWNGRFPSDHLPVLATVRFK